MLYFIKHLDTSATFDKRRPRALVSIVSFWEKEKIRRSNSRHVAHAETRLRNLGGTRNPIICRRIDVGEHPWNLFIKSAYMLNNECTVTECRFNDIPCTLHWRANTVGKKPTRGQPEGNGERKRQRGKKGSRYDLYLAYGS